MLLVWGTWGFWSACSASCNGGTRTRTRTCVGGNPGTGGCLPFTGTTESVTCNTQVCAGIV